MAKASSYIGGSWAPRITAEMIAAYRELIARKAVEPVKTVMYDLCSMCEQFIETPDSALDGKPNPVGAIAKARKPDGSIGLVRTPLVVELEEREIERIFERVPWPHELPAMKELLGKLSDGMTTSPVGKELIGRTETGKEAHREVHGVIDADAKALRDAAHHLLWYADLLSQDIEPLVQDKLVPVEQ